MKKQETLDIVALVKDHPLNKLSNDDHGPLVNRIKERFTNEEQHLFVANFYSYLNYDTRKDYVIELDKVWKWIGFSQKVRAKELLVNNFIEDEDYVIENNTFSGEKVYETPGQPKEIIKLTVHCFKKLCLKAKTKKSDEIHEYYLTLEEVVNELVAEQSEKLKNQLTLKDNQLMLKDKERERIFILNFKNKQVVYMIIVDENGTIKFGHAKDIEQRMKDHRTEFGKEIVLHTVFETIYNREFEAMIKKDPIISQHIISKIYKTNQTELIKLSDKFTLKDLEKCIENLKENINGDLIQNLMKENTELKLKLSECENIIKDYEIKQRNILLNKFTEPINLSSQQVKNNQERIQLYDTNLKLLKTYETIQDTCNETEYYKNAVPQTIHRSIKNNTLYKGYRFWKIERSQPIQEYEIPETYELSKEQTYQRVIQFTKDNKIVDIFSCTKNAAENLYNLIRSGNFVPQNKKLLKSTTSQINKSITNSLSIHTNHSAYEHYWYRESDIPKNLLECYEEYKLNNILPELYIHKNNKQVYKFDENRNLIRTYTSITTACKIEKLNEKRMNKYITEKTLHNQCYFSFLSEFLV